METEWSEFTHRVMFKEWTGQLRTKETEIRSHEVAEFGRKHGEDKRLISQQVCGYEDTIMKPER